MSMAGVLAIVFGSAILASGAELRGTWGASSGSGQRLAGAWTAEAPFPAEAAFTMASMRSLFLSR